MPNTKTETEREIKKSSHACKSFFHAKTHDSGTVSDTHVDPISCTALPFTLLALLLLPPKQFLSMFIIPSVIASVWMSKSISPHSLVVVHILRLILPLSLKSLFR